MNQENNYQVQIALGPDRLPGESLAEYMVRNGRAARELKDLRAQLAASLAFEKTVKVAPPTGPWEAWPAGWMARRNYTTGLRRRQSERRSLRGKIRKLVAAQKAAADQKAGIRENQKRVKRCTFRNMRDVRDHNGDRVQIDGRSVKVDRSGQMWIGVRNNGDFCVVIEKVDLHGAF